MFCFYPKGLAVVRKCQALVYAPGCWLRDNGRVPEEPRITWPCRLRHHRAVAPTGQGQSCCLCHRLPRQPWACSFASVSPMVRAENIQIHLPARSRSGERWHGGPSATTPWQGLTVGGWGPCASAGLSLGGGTKHTAPVAKVTRAASLGCSPASPSSTAASCTLCIPVHGLLGGTGAPAPRGRDPQRCHPPAEKGTGDVAERLPNIQPLGFPAAKTHQVSALNTTLLQD